MSDLKSPCCNVEMRGYTSREYPGDSGYKCVCCGLELSYLQIARGGLDKNCEPWALCKCGKRTLNPNNTLTIGEGGDESADNA